MGCGLAADIGHLPARMSSRVYPFTRPVRPREHHVRNGPKPSCWTEVSEGLRRGGTDRRVRVRPPPWESADAPHPRTSAHVRASMATCRGDGRRSLLPIERARGEPVVEGARHQVCGRRPMRISSPGSRAPALGSSALLGSRAISTSCAAPGSRSHSMPSTALLVATRQREWTFCARCNRALTRCAGRDGSPSSWWVMVQFAGPSAGFCSSSGKGRRATTATPPPQILSPHHSCSPSAMWARPRRPPVTSRAWTRGQDAWTVDEMDVCVAEEIWCGGPGRGSGQ
ncbi:hypothetical protein BW36_01072 [Micrococcus luteus]|nr:hypothetical protein BW36_01072 [Micrococcus luteus]